MTLYNDGLGTGNVFKIAFARNKVIQDIKKTQEINSTIISKVVSKQIANSTNTGCNLIVSDISPDPEDYPEDCIKTPTQATETNKKKSYIDRNNPGGTSKPIIDRNNPGGTSKPITHIDVNGRPSELEIVNTVHTNVAGTINTRSITRPVENPNTADTVINTNVTTFADCGPTPGEVYNGTHIFGGCNESTNNANSVPSPDAPLNTDVNSTGSSNTGLINTDGGPNASSAYQGPVTAAVDNSESTALECKSKYPSDYVQAALGFSANDSNTNEIKANLWVKALASSLDHIDSIIGTIDALIELKKLDSKQSSKDVGSSNTVLNTNNALLTDAQKEATKKQNAFDIAESAAEIEPSDENIAALESAQEALDIANEALVAAQAQADAAQVDNDTLHKSLTQISDEAKSLAKIRGEYQTQRINLEKMIKRIKKLCNLDYTSIDTIYKWVYNYTEYITANTGDCFTIAKLDDHTNAIYTLTAIFDAILALLTSVDERSVELSCIQDCEQNCDIQEDIPETVTCSSAKEVLQEKLDILNADKVIFQDALSVYTADPIQANKDAMDDAIDVVKQDTLDYQEAKYEAYVLCTNAEEPTCTDLGALISGADVKISSLQDEYIILLENYGASKSDNDKNLLETKHNEITVAVLNKNKLVDFKNDKCAAPEEQDLTCTELVQITDSYITTYNASYAAWEEAVKVHTEDTTTENADKVRIALEQKNHDRDEYYKARAKESIKCDNDRKPKTCSELNTLKTHALERYNEAERIYNISSNLLIQAPNDLSVQLLEAARDTMSKASFTYYSYSYEYQDTCAKLSSSHWSTAIDETNAAGIEYNEALLEYNTAVINNRNYPTVENQNIENSTEITKDSKYTIFLQKMEYEEELIINPHMDLTCSAKLLNTTSKFNDYLAASDHYDNVVNSHATASQIQDANEAKMEANINYYIAKVDYIGCQNPSCETLVETSAAKKIEYDNAHEMFINSSKELSKNAMDVNLLLNFNNKTSDFTNAENNYFIARVQEVHECKSRIPLKCDYIKEKTSEQKAIFDRAHNTYTTALGLLDTTLNNDGYSGDVFVRNNDYMYELHSPAFNYLNGFVYDLGESVPKVYPDGLRIPMYLANIFSSAILQRESELGTYILLKYEEHYICNNINLPLVTSNAYSDYSVAKLAFESSLSTYDSNPSDNNKLIVKNNYYSMIDKESTAHTLLEQKNLITDLPNYRLRCDSMDAVNKGFEYIFGEEDYYFVLAELINTNTARDMINNDHEIHIQARDLLINISTDVCSLNPDIGLVSCAEIDNIVDIRSDVFDEVNLEYYNNPTHELGIKRDEYKERRDTAIELKDTVCTNLPKTCIEIKEDILTTETNLDEYLLDYILKTKIHRDDNSLYNESIMKESFNKLNIEFNILYNLNRRLEEQDPDDCNLDSLTAEEIYNAALNEYLDDQSQENEDTVLDAANGLYNVQYEEYKTEVALSNKQCCSEIEDTDTCEGVQEVTINGKQPWYDYCIPKMIKYYLEEEADPQLMIVEKYNCCMNKITLGVEKQHRIFARLDNKMKLNGELRKAEKKHIVKSTTYNNGAHVAIAANAIANNGASAGASGSASAGVGAGASASASASANLSASLNAAASGSFGAGVGGGVALQLGCDSFSLSLSLDLSINISLSLGFSLAFSLCSPSIGALVQGSGSANATATGGVDAGYTANATATGSASAGAGYTANASTTSPGVQGTGTATGSSTNTGPRASSVLVYREDALRATVADPVESYSGPIKNECVPDASKGVAGDLVPPNANLDTHDEILSRAHKQTKFITNLMADLKKQSYCSSLKVNEVDVKDTRTEDVINNVVDILEPIEHPNIDTPIVITGGSFYNPGIPDTRTIINSVLAFVPDNEVITIDTPSEVRAQSFNPYDEVITIDTQKVRAQSCNPNTAAEDVEQALNDVNIIIKQGPNEFKNNAMECNGKLYMKELEACLELPEVLTVNNDLYIDALPDNTALSVTYASFIDSSELLEDFNAQQFKYNSVNHSEESNAIMIQRINGELVIFNK